MIQGFAAHQASGKLNSLEGDLTKLKAAGENAFIDLGSGAAGAPLRHFVQDTTSEIEKLTKSGDLRRWGKELGHDIHTLITDATPLAKELGHALGTIGHAVGHIVDDFNKLPPGVQQAIVTGGLVAYGAHKSGVEPLAIPAASNGKKPVPVFVTNQGFGKSDGAEGARLGEWEQRAA